MGKTFLKEAARLLQAKRQKSRWTRTVISLSLVVALVTSSLLSHPAITMERAAACGMSEHTHNGACYQQNLICGKEEQPAVEAKEEKVLICQLSEHEHAPECQDADGNLICTQEAHKHGDGCYQINQIPGVEGHKHTGTCYQDTLVCQTAEHKHSETCYPVQTEATPSETVPETSAPSTEAQTSAPSTEAQTAAPATEAQTSAPATEAQTTAPETEKATEKEKKESKKEKKETEEVWEAQTLTNKGTDYTITVEASAAAKIPQDAVLKVRELKNDTTPQDYTNYSQQAEAKVQQQLGKEILYGRYFDLTIEADGKEIQPSVPVTVKVTYTKTVEHPQGSEIKVVFFGDQTEILNVTRTNLNNQVWSEAEAEVKSMTVLVFAGIGLKETEAPATEISTELETETAIQTEEITEKATEAESEIETEVGTEEATELTSELESETETVTEEATELTSEVESESETEVSTEETTEVTSEVESESETEVSTEETTEVTSEVESESETEVSTEESTEIESESETETEFAAMANTLTAENDAYKVTVSYDESANLPADVTLSLTNYSENDDEYQAALEAVISAKQGEEGFEADQLQLKALDISILDKDGNELEPESTVSVRIEMKSLPEDWDAANVEVHHIVEEHAAAAYAMARSAARNVSLYADEVASGVPVANGTAVAEFTTESFSTYTITYSYKDSNGSMQDATFKNIHVVVEGTNGNAIEVGTDKSVNVQNNFYLTDLAAQANPTDTEKAYKFVEARYKNNTNDYKTSSLVEHIRLTMIYYQKNVNKWALYDYTKKADDSVIGTLVSNNFHLYLVYEEQTGDDANVTVTYDENGGSIDAPNPDRGRIRSTIKLPAYNGVREGYRFIGWTDTADLESDVNYHRIYDENSEYMLPAENITLYAVWQKENNDEGNMRTDFFIRLDGTIPTEPGSYPSASYTSGIKYENNIKEKHQWIVDVEGSGSSGVHAQNKVTANLNKLPSVEELYSALSEKEGQLGFTVTIVNNELKVATISSKSVNAANYNVKVGNSLFVKWYVQKYQLTSDSPLGKTWHIDGVLLVKEKKTITYVKNTDDQVDSMPLGYQETKGTNVKIGASGAKDGKVYTPIRPGYTFLGWNTEPNPKPGNEGISYNNYDEYVLNDDTILYAQWSRSLNFLTVLKKDETGNVLKEAEFKLEEKSEAGTWSTVASGATSDSGIWTYSNVRSKTIYRLTETKAPKGYLTRETFYFMVTTNEENELDIFVVDENGNKINAPTWLDKVYTPETASGDSAQIDFTITDEQIKQKVIFMKTAMDGETPLKDAEFVLTKSGTDVTDVLLAKSGTDGIFSNSNATLTYGTYVLTETAAPNGYQLTESIEITLDSNSDTGSTELTLSGAGVNYAKVDWDEITSTYTIIVKDRPFANLQILKTNTPSDSVAEQLLSDVTFTLEKKNISDTYEFKRNITISNATDGYQLSDLDDGTYRLTETVAPAGYVIKNAHTIFEVKDGKILFDGANQLHASYTLGILRIRNEAGVALPNTGGSGTLPYTLSGLMVLLSAMMYGFVLRRRRERGLIG